MEDDGRAREELLAEVRILRDRLQKAEEALGDIRAEQKHNAHQHAEDEAHWTEERETERAILQVEKNGHRHADEELGKTRDQLRDVSFKLLQAEEAERKRIAQEIHDSIGQYWVVVKHRVEAILKQIGTEVTGPLEDLLPVIHVGIEETRRIQMNLRPTLLDNLGILATISWLTREFQKANPAVDIKTTLDIHETDVPNSVKTVIYRILQEALNNIAKHSQADRVDLTLQKGGDTIELIIQDHGRGFNAAGAYSQKSTDAGLGLAGMQERAILSGGSTSIESAVGKGTTIRASWPLAV